MDIGVLGINYKSSELMLRERFAKICQKWIETDRTIPVVLLSTCNRTEIYFSSGCLTETYSEILSRLKKRFGDPIEQKIYVYFAEHCFAHLAKVSCGLESVIFGEAEIQRQVKRSYEEACLRYKLPSLIHYLFQKSLKIGKEIRTEFKLPRGTVSIESTLWDLSKLFFPEQKNISVLFVGYSQINRNIMHFLKQKKGIALHLATRNESVIEPGERGFFSSIPWLHISLWSRFEMVVTASKCSEYLLTPDQLPTDGSPVNNKLVIDLGLPRNVDPSVGKNPLVSLFNIEDVGGLIDRKKTSSATIQTEVEEKVEETVFRQLYLHRKRDERVVACI